MTIQAQVSVYSQILVPRDYEVFAGLDVDHHSIAATFSDHQRLLQSLRLPYSAQQLLNYVRKHFAGQRGGVVVIFLLITIGSVPSLVHWVEPS